MQQNSPIILHRFLLRVCYVCSTSSLFTIFIFSEHHENMNSRPQAHPHNPNRHRGTRFRCFRYDEGFRVYPGLPRSNCPRFLYSQNRISEDNFNDQHFIATLGTRMSRSITSAQLQLTFWPIQSLFITSTLWRNRCLSAE